MSIFIITFVIMAIAIIGMAIGVLLGRPAIKGSCGGLNQVGLAGSCSGVCSSEEKEICAKRKQDQQDNS
ncbi:(Na+)-NQR maturation NqrM [Shewanella sp.]|uniref:(Na+)-NQR maturation NqrM n=1 Tax=Shewanella sp. TaxID=50422 RepID=UPI00258573FE|nr:(Na+)-NQR maturation NqrM [Shewanella sp.]MCJ8305133.1 (Na+)-NQR maturation NqrM [Shewanella sp.]NQY27662.1 (Na+)-NQR maturation NqrM [Piscirickettsiaceae bacterium]